MLITCSQCESKFNVPDEKIPKGKKIKVICPKCRSPIIIGEEIREEKAPPPPEPTEKKEELEEEEYGYEEYTEDSQLGFFEGDAKLALVLVDDGQIEDLIRPVVEEMGYRFITSPNKRDAIGKMRFHHFDIIILKDGYDGKSIEESPILRYINTLSMSVRRKMFLALISDRFKTMDNMMAFAMSANVVINSADISQIKLILNKAIEENERFYKVFKELLVETGKE